MRIDANGAYVAETPAEMRELRLKWLQEVEEVIHRP